MKLNLEKNIFQLYQELEVELKIHCENVAQLTECLYYLSIKEKLFEESLSLEILMQIKKSVIYHDLGKCMLKSSVLNKRGPLTELEYEWVKRHVDFGLMLVEGGNGVESKLKDDFIMLKIIWEAIAHHHERYNGTGYPKGLVGDEISPIGQMCGLCDYYDALTSDRSYHKALSHDNAMKLIKKESGILFNPALVDLLVKNENEFCSIKDN